MKPRKILNVVAIVLAAFAGIAVYVYAMNADQRAIARQQPVDIVVSTQVIPRGMSLKGALDAGYVSQTQVATFAEPAGVVHRITEINGALVALNEVPAGQPLFSENFAEVLPNVGPLDVPKGMLAVTVELKDPAHVASFVVPGSQIAIFETATLLQANETSLEMTTVLINQVEVLAVDRTTLTQESAEGESAATDSQETLVTVAVTPAQATVLVHAANTATLYFGLLDEETVVDELDRVTTQDIFAGRR